MGEPGGPSPTAGDEAARHGRIRRGEAAKLARLPCQACAEPESKAVGETQRLWMGELMGELRGEPGG